jgi:hypothetical protein
MSKKHLMEKIRRNAIERDRYYKMWVDADMEVWELRRENERLQAEVEHLTQSKSVNLYEESLALTLTDIATWVFMLMTTKSKG